MRDLRFIKVSGAGNDFILFAPQFAGQIPIRKRKHFSIKLCDRNHAVGADGVVFLSKVARNILKWDFYNSDGTFAEMCGNAARGVGRWYFDCFEKRAKKFELQTGAGKIIIEKEGEQIKVQMPKATIEMSAPFLVNTGVPHLVLVQKTLKPTRFYKKIQGSVRGGTNVTVISRIKRSGIDAVTFERGVDNFTLACGTGAVAAAVYVHWKTKQEIINVKMPGGSLTVDLSHGRSRPFLIGEGKVCFEGVLKNWEKL